MNNTEPNILIHIDNYLSSSDIEKKSFESYKIINNLSVKIKYNHNSDLSKKELLHNISKILLDLSNEDEELLLNKVKIIDKTNQKLKLKEVLFNNIKNKTKTINFQSISLKDLLHKYNYPYYNIKFKYNRDDMITEYISIGYNYANKLVCDYDLINPEPQESIFKDEYNKYHWNQDKDGYHKCNWCQTPHILKVKVEMKTFKDNFGKQKEPIHIAKELWYKLLEENSIIDYSSCCIVYDELYEDTKTEKNYSIKISNIVEKLQKIKITKINISDNILSDEGLIVLVNELVKHYELLEVNISNNHISDVGLRYLKKLSLIGNIKIIIKNNYGPSKETLDELIGLSIEY